MPLISRVDRSCARPSTGWMVRRLLPPGPFLESIGARVLLIWMFLRIVILVGSMMESGSISNSIPASILASCAIASLIIALLFIDMSRRSELLFLANLGHSFRGIALVVVAECAVLETVLRMAVG